MIADVIVAESKRLRRIRDALLDAPYTICTQKAVLLTDYFQSSQRTTPLLRPLEAAHYRAYPALRK